MIPVGPVDATFNIRTQGLDVCFDPASQQQVLSFQFALTVSLPQILQQLLEYQRRAGSAAPGLVPPAMSQSQMSMPASQMSNTSVAAVTGAPTGEAQHFVTDMNLGPHSNPGIRLGNRQGNQRHMQGTQQQPLVTDQLSSPGQSERLHSPSWQQQQQQGRSGHPVTAPLSQPGQQWERIPDLNTQLISAVRDKNLVAVRQLVVQKAEVNTLENGPGRRTPLQHALEVGGDIDTVHLLLQAKSDPNIVMAGGMTAVHHAIEQYMHVPPIVLRMLLCAKGDLNTIVNARNMTALDSAKLVARTSFASPGNSDSDIRVRQLLNEVTEQPTVAISVVDSSEILNVLFADTVNDNIAYYTESALYLYSLKSQRVVFLKKLRQTTCRSQVRHVAVNPELGTIAVCLEILQDSPNGEAVQNVSIVWPNGQLTDEEPLKLSTPFAEGPNTGALPACVTLSRCRGPQVLVCRFSSCEVYCWRLNAARSQLVHESKLLSHGGHIATSDDGLWIAVENKEIEAGEAQIGVWSYESLEGLPRPPKLVHTMSKKPVALSIMQQDSQSCCLAIVECSEPGHQLPPIEIFSITLAGGASNIYRVRLAAPCLSLDFCHAVPTHLLSGHEDGLVVVYNLPDGVISLSHDGPGTRAISISSDRTLIASAENTYVRVYKVPPYEDP